MKQESRISKINQELISTFASLDAWFDKILDDDPRSDHGNVLRHLITSNYHLLDMLADGYDSAIADVVDVDRDGKDVSYHALRFALRGQLYRCLCLLDELDEHACGEDEKEMNVYDKLSSLTHHLQFHLEELEQIQSVEL